MGSDLLNSTRKTVKLIDTLNSFLLDSGKIPEWRLLGTYVRVKIELICLIYPGPALQKLKKSHAWGRTEVM